MIKLIDKTAEEISFKLLATVNHPDHEWLKETLKQLVSLGENTDYQKQHIENIKDMVGKERIFK